MDFDLGAKVSIWGIHTQGFYYVPFNSWFKHWAENDIF